MKIVHKERRNEPGVSLCGVRVVRPHWESGTMARDCKRCANSRHQAVEAAPVVEETVSEEATVSEGATVAEIASDPDTMTRDEALSLIRRGGKPWAVDGKPERIYIDRWHGSLLEVSRYGSGNISSAGFMGMGISNSAARRVLDTRVYWSEGRIYGLADVASHVRGAARVLSESEIRRALIASVRG